MSNSRCILTASLLVTSAEGIPAAASASSISTAPGRGVNRIEA